ncbi:ABC transporter G family member 23-like [Brevipalpus obovatus]|uniref:ABC transporter G family member 23-like n=1 Tax=Brevipalpus obovatus TaxID=246614 RepID=UPI003D9EFD3D
MNGHNGTSSHPNGNNEYVAAIKARSVTYVRNKSEGKVNILNDLNLTVPIGEVYALIGPSGCGKTTFLRCVIGYKDPNFGRIKIFGLQPGQKGLDIPGKNIGYMPQEIALNCDLTILEMLVYFGHIYGISDQDLVHRIRDLLNLLDLNDMHRLIGNLSGGQQRRVSFAATVLHRPKLLILDEPTVGCDPLVRERMWGFIFYLCQQYKCSVVITTHYIEEARRADVVGFMRKGTILAEDEPAVIINRFGVRNLEETFEHLCREDKLRKQSSIASIASYNGNLSKKKTEKRKKKAPVERCKNFIAKQLQEGDYWRIQSAVMNRIFLRFYKMKAAFYGSGFILFFVITVYGLFYGRTPIHLNVGVVNHEYPVNLSSKFLETIDRNRVIPTVYQQPIEALEATRRGDIQGFINFGTNFTRFTRTRIVPLDMSSPYAINPTIDLTSGNIVYRGDFSNIILLITIMRSLLESYRNFTIEVAADLKLNTKLTDLPIVLAEPIYGQIDRDDYFGVYDFILPVFAVYLAFVHTVNFSLFSLMREKLDLMFERNYAAGVTTNQLLIGHFMVYMAVTGTHVLILLLFILYVLEVPCRGSVVLALCVLLLQVATGITTTFIFALFSSGIGMMFIFTTGYLLACMFVGGVLWPIEALPYYMRSFRFFTPFSTSPSAMIAVMVKGLPLTHPSVYMNLIAPILYFLVTTLISFSCFTY